VNTPSFWVYSPNISIGVTHVLSTFAEYMLLFLAFFRMSRTQPYDLKFGCLDVWEWMTLFHAL